MHFKIDAKLMKNLSQHNQALSFDCCKELKVTRNVSWDHLPDLWKPCQEEGRRRSENLMSQTKGLNGLYPPFIKMEVFSFVIERDDSLKWSGHESD